MAFSLIHNTRALSGIYKSAQRTVYVLPRASNWENHRMDDLTVFTSSPKRRIHLHSRISSRIWGSKFTNNFWKKWRINIFSKAAGWNIIYIGTKKEYNWTVRYGWLMVQTTVRTFVSGWLTNSDACIPLRANSTACIQPRWYRTYEGITLAWFRLNYLI